MESLEQSYWTRIDATKDMTDDVTECAWKSLVEKEYINRRSYL